jgi:GR25 family glycosyltransferase involved in LPS biosynthesis
MKNDKYDTYLDGIDIIYYINLERSKDRKRHMEKFFKDSVFHNKKIVRFNAIDYKKVDVYKKIKTNSIANIFRVTKPEYACLLSHLEVIRKFSKTNYKHALIFEDDLELIDKKLWNEPIKNIIENAPKDYDIIKLYRKCDENLQYKNMYTLWDVKKDNLKIIDWGMLAYVISNKAAKKLMDKIYVNGKYVLNDNFIHLSDYLIYKELKTYIYYYPFFTVVNYSNNNIPTTVQIYKKKTKKFFNDGKKRFNKNKTCKYIDYKKFK